MEGLEFIFVIIEILEDYLKFIKQFDNNSAFIPALENLIKEYKELKEQNNKLKSCEGILDVFSLGKESSRQRIEFDYIPKSKIINLLENYVIDISGFECISARDLQVLLEEGE